MNVTHLLLFVLVGFVVSWCVSSILYSILVNHLFRWSVALILLYTSCGLFLRAKMQTCPRNHSLPTVARLGALSVGVGSAASALAPYALTNGWPRFATNCLLSTIGVSVSYAMLFLLTDVSNRIGPVAQRLGNLSGGPEFTARQLYTVVAMSVLLGGSCGLLFTLVDVEEHAARIGTEQWIAALIGAVSGLVVYYAGTKALSDNLDVAFDPLPSDDTDIQ